MEDGVLAGIQHPAAAMELEESFGPPIAAVEGDIVEESIYDTHQYEMAAREAEDAAVEEIKNNNQENNNNNNNNNEDEKEEGERDDDDEDEEGELDDEEEEGMLVEEEGVFVKEGPEVEKAIVGQVCSHPVHICRKCNLPVLTAGRLHPCYHSFCLECAGEVKRGSCYMYV